MPKGEKLMAKAKGPHHHPVFKILSLPKIGSFLKKTLLTAKRSKNVFMPKRGELIQGELLFGQKKRI
jgi:hypothetical protein